MGYSAWAYSGSPIRSTPLVEHLVRNINSVRRIKESDHKRRTKGQSGRAYDRPYNACVGTNLQRGPGAERAPGNGFYTEPIIRGYLPLHPACSSERLYKFFMPSYKYSAPLYPRTPRRYRHRFYYNYYMYYY